VRDFGIVEVVEREFLRTFRRFPLPSSVDEATNSRRIAIRLAGHAAKRARPQAEIWPMIFSIVAPCTALSFHLPRRHSLAHTPKTLERARAMPYSLSHAAAATGLTRR
jgi:hypothetical protein